MTKAELLQEYFKCEDDYPYYAQKYLKTFNEMDGKKVPFQLFPQQEELVDNLNNHRFNIIPKSRQSGISTTCAMYVACHMIFEKDRKICVVAHQRMGAENFMAKIIDFIDQRPKWLGDDKSKRGIYVISKRKSGITLSNGSEAVAFASSSDSIRGFTPTMLILDECAFIPNAKELWTAASPSLSTGGRAIFISTPNGKDELFYKTYNQSLKGENNFFITYIRWWRDQRYNKGLEWVKDDEVIPESINEEKMLKLYKNGYEPRSPWFVETCKLLNNNSRRIAQEYQIEFLGSSDTVIPTEAIQRLQKSVNPPIRLHDEIEGLFYWNEYNEEHKYLIASDVASGTGNDYLTFAVLDMTDMEFVADYCGKVPPEVLASYLNDIGIEFGNAPIAVDITGGWGVTTVVTLADTFNYKNIYHSKIRNATLKDRLDTLTNPQDGYLAGFKITATNRQNIVEEFSKLVRNEEVIIHSQRAVSEMTTFVYGVNGKADHMKGYHDDLLFAYMIATFIVVYDYQNIRVTVETTKSMLNAMLKVNGKKNVQKKVKKSRGDYNMFDKNNKKDVIEQPNTKKLPKHGFLF